MIKVFRYHASGFAIEPEDALFVAETLPCRLAMDSIIVEERAEIMDLVGGRDKKRLMAVIGEVVEIRFFAFLPPFLPEAMVRFLGFRIILRHLADDRCDPNAEFLLEFGRSVSRNILKDIMQKPGDDDVLIVGIVRKQECDRVWMHDIRRAAHFAFLAVMQVGRPPDGPFDVRCEKHAAILLPYRKKAKKRFFSLPEGFLSPTIEPYLIPYRIVMAKTAKKAVAVIGLGYVGLPLAVRASERGYDVVGFDIDERKITALKQGKQIFKDAYLKENQKRFPIMATSDPKDIERADIHIICVPTPVDERRQPDLKPVIGASETVAKHCKKGVLVVLESTVNPYVSEEVVKPIFEEYGFTVGKDVFISHCPERINPGDPKWDVTNIPRVVGSFDQKGLRMSLDFYRSIVDADIRPMKSIREAEATKILENSFRNVNIAFVNEIAMSFDKLGIDVKDVIQGASTKPFAFMAHYPSCGIGGHCIPVDPHYLVERAKQSGFDHVFLRHAIETNDNMPAYAVDRLQDALNKKKVAMNGTTIGVLGLAYKADIDDLRESPALEVIKHLKEHKAKVESYDPYLPKLSTVKSLEALLKKSDALFIATNHKEFIEALTPALLKKHKIKAILDGKNCLDRDLFMKEKSFIYRGIGR